MTTQLQRIDQSHSGGEYFQAPAISLAVAGVSLLAGLVGWVWNVLQPGSSSLDAFLLIGAAFLLQGIVGHLKARSCRKGFSATPGLPASHLPAAQFKRLSQARWN